MDNFLSLNFIVVLLWILVVYFVASNLVFFIQVLAAFRHVVSEKKRPQELPSSFLENPKPKLSVLIPCFNEDQVIVQNALSVLRNRYAELEVIIINDGSTDQTFDVLNRAFTLNLLSEKSDFKVYRSERFKNLLVLDQKNFGKATSLNHALQVCSGTLVATIDADTYVVEDAFLKSAWYLAQNPDCKVLGGIVRVMNGAKTYEGQVLQGKLPRRLLPLFQTIEYIRSFFGGRLGWESIGGSALVPGAFSIFEKNALLAVDGFDPLSVTEDFEVVIRMKLHFAAQKKPCEIHMISWPVCWTEVPDDMRELFQQRVRWQRGLLQTLLKHKSLIGNPVAGRMGLFTLPSMLVFEALAPLVELLGYIVVPIAYYKGIISTDNLLLFLALGILFYSLLTIATVHLEERYYARHFSKKSFFIFLLYSFLENFGYRQFIFLARAKGTMGIFSRGFWGQHERGYDKEKLQQNQSENVALALIAGVIMLVTFVTLQSGRSTRFAPPTKLDELQTLLQTRDAEIARGAFDKALEATESLHRQAPANAVYLSQLADLRRKTGHYLEAAEAWEELLKISSDYEEACPTLGRNYQEAGLNDKAFAAHQLCFQKLPQNTDVIYFLAREFERREDYDKALELYQRGRELSSTYTDMTEAVVRVQTLLRNKKRL